jgi:hypothetical protein
MPLLQDEGPFPGRCAVHSGPRSARPEHRLHAALLIRGHDALGLGPGSAVHREGTLHRVRRHEVHCFTLSQAEVSDPHGEERGGAARLEP